jgi:microcystin-dependent protein
MSEAFIGEIRLFGGTFAPVSWHFCDGTVLAIASNTPLFSLIGTTYGGNGQTTFALPDLRGRLPVCTGTGNGLPAVSLGQVWGSESVTVMTSQMPMHNHLVQASTTNPVSTNMPGTSVSFGALDQTLDFYVDTTQGTPNGQNLFSPNAVSYQGGNLPHENRMPCQAINYIICLEGIFPSSN